jgi:hypothetical protein
MSALEITEAAVRVWGADFDPNDVSTLLGMQPSRSHHKSDIISGTAAKVRIAKMGEWRLQAPSRFDGNLDAQIVALLSQLPDDLAIWREVSERYSADIFCGLFMQTFNDGLSLEASTFKMLADRKLKLKLDIYCSTED